MRKIVVTGCAGFIGSHVCEHLIDQNYTLIGLDNFDPFYSRSIKENNITDLLKRNNFTFTEADLTNLNSCIPHFKNADLVIHLAGKAGVRPSILEPQLYIDHNITATKNVLEAMRLNNVHKMLFASSSSIYGNNPQVPWSESLNVDNPISPYAFSKKACELLNYTYHHLYQLDILNLRFFTVFGPRQRPDLAIHKFVRLIENGEQITMFGDGQTSRDYTFVSDTCNGILSAMNYLLETDGVYNTINLGNNHPVQLRHLIQMLGEATGTTPDIQQLPMQPGDVNTTYADITKAQKLIGYRPKVKMEEGLQAFVNWYRQTHLTKSI